MQQTYALAFPKSDDYLYLMMSIDTDRRIRNDYVYTCTKQDLIKFIKEEKEIFINMHLNGDEIFSDYPIAQLSTHTANLHIDIHAAMSVCDFWQVLISNHMNLRILDKLIPCHKVSFSMSSDIISYAGPDRQAIALWKLPSILELSKQNITIQGDPKIISWAVSVLSALPLAEDECVVNMSLLAVTPVYATCFMRYHTEELQYIASRYHLLRAYIHGIECGSWYMHHLAGIDSQLFSHYKPKLANARSGISFVFDIDFPNAVKCSKALEEDDCACKTLFKIQSQSEFYDVLHKYTNCRNISKYFISFADGMQSQLSGSHILKDHEILQLDSLQSELSILACKLFEYRLAMEYAPIDILKKIQLVSGTLNIVKEDANS